MREPGITPNEVFPLGQRNEGSGNCYSEPEWRAYRFARPRFLLRFAARATDRGM